MVEIWKDIEGFEGIYQVSNFGRIKSLDRYIQERTGRMKNNFVKGKILSPKKKKYYEVSLARNQCIKQVFVHRLVAEAFIVNGDSKPQVNHKDGDKYNNNVYNLEWCTAKENVTHAIYTGLTRIRKGDERHNTVIPDIDIELIRFLKNKLSYRDLAYFFNTTASYINGIISNRKRVLAIQSFIGIIITLILAAWFA